MINYRSVYEPACSFVNQQGVHGMPAALIVRGEGLDKEQIELGSSAAF
jgi:hypothetical protein